MKAIVVASSDKAYGAATTLPYTETTPLAGEHPYDASKSCADLIAQSYARTYELPVAITRCGNFYGGGDLNWNRIVPGTIRSILRGERPIMRSDGQVRPRLLLRRGCSRCLHACWPRRCGAIRSSPARHSTFPTGEPLSVLEIVDRHPSAMESNLEPIMLNEASNEIREQYLNSEKAREDARLARALQA